jgi:hypothetical protein
VSVDQSAHTPIDYGDIVVDDAASYWLQNAADLKAYANTSKVTSVAATFTWQDVGRKLRVPAADITLGVDETYSGFLTIVSVESANEVTVERTFESQSAGTFTAVGDDGGGDCRFSAVGHGLAVGDAVTIDGVTGTWDGIHVVTNVPNVDQFDTDVTYGAGTDTGTWDQGQKDLTWATLNFGALDRVRFDNTTDWFRHLGRELATVSYKIIDVPSDTEIQVEYMDIPDTITDSFSVEREFDLVDTGAYANNQDFEDGGFNAYAQLRSGLWGVSDEAQFLTIAEDTARTATSGADADDDGWSDDLTLTGHNVAAAVDDWILLYSPLTQADDRFRRWYKIKSITPGPDTDIVTYEDEIPAGEDFKWKVARKRDMKMRSTYTVVSGYEPIT